MAGLEGDIDFKNLSDDELQRLLDEEREKRKQFAPVRSRITNSGTGGKKPATKRAPKSDTIEIDLD